MISAKVEVDLSGFRFVIEENKRREITLKGVRAGAKALDRKVKAGTPTVTRTLQQSQGVLAKKGTKGSTLAFAVQGVRRRYERMVTPPGRKTPMRAVPAFYDHLVQGGVKPHSVSKGQRLGQSQYAVKRKQGSKSGFFGYKLVGKNVARTDQTGRQHPGARANPYRKREWGVWADVIGKLALQAMAIEEQRLVWQARLK